MANQKIIDAKATVVDEIAEKMKSSATYVLFDYQGLTVSDTNELRRKLRESGSDLKGIQKYINSSCFRKIKYQFI